MNYQLNNIVSAARAVSFCGVDLYGKNLKQRAKELISIAHPIIGKSWKKKCICA